MRHWRLAVLVLLLLTLALVRSAEAQRTEADVYVAQAIVDFDDKRYDAALQDLRRALQIEPDHVQALYYTGLVHMALRQPDLAVPFLERARAQTPSDPVVAFQLGLAYFAQGQYERAEPLLEEALRGQPELDGLGYYVGFLRYRQKDYRGALRGFRAGRTGDAEIRQLTRLYTGLALAALGLPGEAVSEVEQALRLAPGSPLTGPAERLRDAVVVARQQERRFTAEVRVGLFYDDNVRVLPNPAPPGDPDADPAVEAVRRQSRQPRDSVGETLGVRGEYTWWRAAEWESSLGYSFFFLKVNDLPSFDILDHLASVTLLRKDLVGSLPLQTGGHYAFDALSLGGPEFLQRHTAVLFSSLAESDRHLTQALVRFQDKDFNQDPERTPREESRDASNYMVGGQHYLRFSADRHYVKLGYQFDYEDAGGRNFEYRGHRILFGGQYTLPWFGVRLRYDFDEHIRDYVNRHSLLPTNAPGRRRRADNEVNHTVRVEVPLPYNLTVVAEYLDTRNVSNLAVLDYSRTVTSLTLSWSY